jgi:endonuclease YncB( thermonuclease family)
VVLYLPDGVSVDSYLKFHDGIWVDFAGATFAGWRARERAFRSPGQVRAGVITARSRCRCNVRAARPVAVVAVLATASILGWWLGEQRRAANPQVRVIEVIDGDTIAVAFANGNTDTVRILGVDTPETHHPTKGVECFGPEAAAYTAARLTGRVVQLVGDVEPRDIYDRRLAYVIVDGHRFEDELLRQGYARLLVIEPNRAHARDLLDAELDARRANRGLWAECGEGR